jgi:nitric oxide reductase subunit B
MQKQLQGIDLTQPTVVLPDAAAQAVRTLQAELTTKLNTVNLSAGWVPAKSLDPVLRQQTADFIIYSAVTTVARRPDHPNTSWTENWPYEPSVGNTPTTNTFQWTWISFCFTFFAMGFVLWLYRAYLDHPDDAPMERGLAEYRTLTPSQVKTGKYFIVVALVFLASQGAGAIMAHSYYERETFYGIQLNYILPFNFLRSFHLQAPIIDRARLDRERPVHCPGNCRRPRGERAGRSRRPPVLGLAVRGRRRAARKLSRHPGGH